LFPFQFEKEDEDIFGLGELLQTNAASGSSSSKRKAPEESSKESKFCAHNQNRKRNYE
jgi:hypothetical protein